MHLMHLEVPGTQQVLKISQIAGEAGLHTESTASEPCQANIEFGPFLDFLKTVKQNTPTLCSSG